VCAQPDTLDGWYSVWRARASEDLYEVVVDPCLAGGFDVRWQTLALGIWGRTIDLRHGRDASSSVRVHVAGRDMQTRPADGLFGGLLSNVDSSKAQVQSCVTSEWKITTSSLNCAETVCTYTPVHVDVLKPIKL
jgi:hypothetical protein